MTYEEESDSLKRRVAIHESGHAVVAKIVTPDRGLKMITIVPDAGGSLGKTNADLNQDGDTETSMKAQLAIWFGGRNAERLILGVHSAGCSNDISSAKRLASYMIN